MNFKKVFLKIVKLIFLFLIWLSLFFWLSCAPRPKIKTSPPPSLSLNFETSIKIAQSELGRGCYFGFKKALEGLRPLITLTSPWPELKARALLLYLRTGLLLAMREKELGLTTSTLSEFASFLSSERILSFSEIELIELADFYEIVKSASVKSKGIMAYDDRQFEAKSKVQDWEKWKKDLDRLKEEAEQRMKRMEKRAQEDEVAAYFWLTAYTHFFSYRNSELKPLTVLSLFPRSRLVRFKLAIISEPIPRKDLLDELLQEEPEFYEAHYFLGEAAIRRGLLISAEKHYLQAWKAFPESPIIAISLASVYFHLEELEKSMEMYEAALGLLPGYREAMLGKAICLSYLSRHDEAIKGLQEMIDLGYWLLGEAHYWMAWNLYRLNRFNEALTHCEEAKGRLPTSSEVFSLTGTVALELDFLPLAEENLKKSLEFDAANAEALLGLARLEARREKWSMAGEYYERATRIYENQALAIRTKMKEIEASEMSDERKKAQLRRKEAQLENILLTKATCLYNGAICYFKAGMMTKALKMAEEAASHPSLKAKASDLISKIKFRPRLSY
ncbi:MAG: tetratricopeptide repeat protein [Candidatus Aminicenantes bacterium]|nr:tetratricopeptide repeat protein [Candidatus Aminicenantes bacterium]